MVSAALRIHNRLPGGSLKSLAPAVCDANRHILRVWRCGKYLFTRHRIRYLERAVLASNPTETGYALPSGIPFALDDAFWWPAAETILHAANLIETQ